MIAKQVKGSGFRGTLNYLMLKPEAELIGGNMLGESPRELASEFAESRKLRPNLEKAVYHASLSLAPGEKFSDEKWQEVTGRYTKEMGFEGSQYVVVRHKDTNHDHVHIVASRIRMDGTVVSDSHDYKRSEKVVRSIELDNGLKIVPNSRDVLHRAPTGDELRKAIRIGKPSTRMQLQGLVDTALSGSPDVTEFFSRLDAMGVQAVPNVAKTGHVSGISYVLSGEVMKGSDLGRGYTWQGIQKRGVSYGRNVERESKAINERSERGKDLLKREFHPAKPSHDLHPPDRTERHAPKREGVLGVSGENNLSRRGDEAFHSAHKRNPGKDESLHGKLERGVEGHSSLNGISRIIDKIAGKETDSKNVDSHDLSRHPRRPDYHLRLLNLAASLGPGKNGKSRVEKFQEEIKKAQELSEKLSKKKRALEIDRDDGPDKPDGPTRGRRISRGPSMGF